MSVMQQSAACSALLLLLGLAASPAASQARPAELPLLRPGQTVSGTITANDPTNGRSPFKLYRFDAVAGQRYVLMMQSTDFDAYLSVTSSDAGPAEPLVSDDDSGGGTDARLRFLAPATGRYHIVAQSWGGDGLGAFTLSLEEAPLPAAARPVGIRIGQTVRGSLHEGSPRMEEDDTPYDLYTFEGRAGQRVQITMRSQAFDAFLVLGRMSDGERHTLAEDDDGGGGTDSRIRYELLVGGTYEIYAGAFADDAEGAYTLTVEELAPPVVRPTQPLRLGAQVSDDLRETDPQMVDGSHYRDWSYTARAGERVRIVMRSETFDTFLSIGRMVNGELQVISSNDDGPDGTDSLLELTLDQAGSYVIRASSLFASETGPYTLRIDRAR
jgi:hypothetical protein